MDKTYTPKELADLIDNEGLYSVLARIPSSSVTGSEELRAAYERAFAASEELIDFEDLLFQIIEEDPEELQDTVDLISSEVVPSDPLVWDPDAPDEGEPD